MRGITWNCRSIKRKGVTSFLRNLILEHNFHLIALQETMQESIEDKIIRSIDPNQEYLWKWISSRGRSGGILSGVNLELYDVGSFFERNFALQLNLWYKKNKVKWNFINLHGAAQEENKNDFLVELASMLEPVLVCGDFNIIRFSS
jgi:exonuclease III